MAALVVAACERLHIFSVVCVCGQVVGRVVAGRRAKKQTPNITLVLFAFMRPLMPMLLLFLLSTLPLLLLHNSFFLAFFECVTRQVSLQFKV